MSTPPNASSPRLPDVIILGVQKGGTSSLQKSMREAAGHSLSCFAHNEPHFWDQTHFSKSSVSQRELSRYSKLLYATASGPKSLCWPTGRASDRTNTRLLIEKTPDYYSCPHVAFRLCESLGQPKLVMLLRNPVWRSHSSFYQGTHSILSIAGLNMTSYSFHKLVTMEIGIVNQCKSTVIPTGDPKIDLIQSAKFSSCCRAVAREQGFKYWPGCSCDHLFGKTTQSIPSCSTFGDRRLAQVRNSIYIWHVRRILRFHKPSNLLFLKSEDMFLDFSNAVNAIVRFASPPSLAPAYERILSNLTIHSFRNMHRERLNMWNTTRELLFGFFAPYNDELEYLLERDFW